MSESGKQFVPRWARENASDYEQLALMPNSGTQPELKPKLVTRLLPFEGGNAISAKTLVDAASTTQRILQFVGHDIAYGSDSAFSDLRTLNRDVLGLSTMKIEPFEEGSFVIPATLPEDAFEVNGKKFNGKDVLERFTEVLSSLSGREMGASHISMGLVQSIYDLGRIVRREASIEYTSTWGGGGQPEVSSFLVDDQFVKHISNVRTARIDRDIIPDELTGRLTALDINQGKLSLTLEDKTTVTGTFELFMQATLVECMNDYIQVWGVIERIRGTPNHIRVFSVERIDSSKKERT